MATMNKVLVPLDGSPLAEAVLPCAVSLAQRLQASVELLQVTEGYSLRAPELPVELALEMQQRGQQRAQEYLQQCSSRFAPLRVACHTPQGSPRSEIGRVALEQGCQLIVMATHGREGIRRWLLGSVAEAVLRHAPCPVLLVRPPVDCGSLFQHILLPVDSSKASLDFLRVLPTFLAPGGKVTLLRCTDLSVYPLLNSKTDLIQEYFDLLKSDLSQVHQEGLNLEVAVLEGEPEEVILNWSAQNHCDLIALASSGRSGLKHFWLGSVTEKVVRHSSCPVLVFPCHSQFQADQLASATAESRNTPS